jgi:hypothetical protein
MIDSITATYGGVDCSEAVKSKFKNGVLIIRSDNNIIGDTKVGEIKYLVVNINGETFSTREGDIFIYPNSSKKKLGIFYSNNNNHKIQKTIIKSLKSIEISAKDKADILTCMWQHEPENPFPEYISWTKTQSHLNQLLQILQLLYTARKIGQYETVSFLEHDVLYPENYFDYPNFNTGEVITNMNYIGLCELGWQEVPVKHEPFHQMTMKFNDAIKHCESILENALITNSGLIEPQINNINRKKWDCKNPCVHVNHGFHFTSHFSIYSKTNINDNNYYWGNYKDYLNLFNK